MKVDVYKHKERYLNWKEKTTSDIPVISEYNSNLLKQYLSDMEKGIGMIFLLKLVQREHYNIPERNLIY